jgi:hypothetical protein
LYKLTTNLFFFTGGGTIGERALCLLGQREKREFSSCGAGLRWLIEHWIGDGRLLFIDKKND